MWIKVQELSNSDPIDPESITMKRFIRRLHYAIYDKQCADIPTFVIYKHKQIPYQTRILGITAKLDKCTGVGVLSYILSCTRLVDNTSNDDLSIELGISNPAYYDLRRTSTRTYEDTIGDEWSTVGIIQNIQDYNVSYIPVDTSVDSRFYTYHC